MQVIIRSRSDFRTITTKFGVRVAAEVASQQGIALAVVQLWVKRIKQF
jgi:hypothetical protein